MIDWGDFLIAVAVAFVTACFARHNGFKSRKAAAATKFRNSVLEALTGLYPVPVAWPADEITISDVLQARFPELQAAVAEFAPYLNILQRWRFKKAWNQYRLGRNGREIDQQDYSQYIPFTGAEIVNGLLVKNDQSKTYKSVFKRSVDQLLGFAGEL